MDKKNLYLIHIGKTGGSSVFHCIEKHGINIRQSHFSVPGYDPIYDYFTIVRSPIDRFISAYRFEYALSHQIERAKNNSDTLEGGNLAPHALKGGGHNKKFKDAIKGIETPNDFAELMFDNPILLDFPHIKWSISKYFHKKFMNDLKKNNKLFFVGRQEYFDEDMNRFNKIIGENVEYKVLRKNKINEHLRNRNSLSQKAINNIKKLYRNDYRVIEEFKQMGLINKDYLKDEL